MVQTFLNANSSTYVLDSSSYHDLKRSISLLIQGDYVILTNNKLLNEQTYSALHSDATLRVCFSLKGGKGGFGATLRRQPTVKKRTDNYDSCRDLSGTRVRFIRQKQMLKEWEEKKKEEERIIETYNDVRGNVEEVIKANTLGKHLNKANKKFLLQDLYVEEAVRSAIDNCAEKKMARKTLDKEANDDNLLDFNL